MMIFFDVILERINFLGGCAQAFWALGHILKRPKSLLDKASTPDFVG